MSTELQLPMEVSQQQTTETMIKTINGKETNKYSFKDGDWVTRLYYVDELNKTNGGTPRFIAINYSINIKTKEVKYGASVYHRDTNDTDEVPTKTFLKTHLRETAQGRLNKRHVSGLVIEADSMKDLHTKIRKLLCSHGAYDQTRKIKN